MSGSAPRSDAKIVVRETKETSIRCRARRAATGRGRWSPPAQPVSRSHAAWRSPATRARPHAQATGDLPHHLIEDVGDRVGAALRGARPGHRGALRRPHRPMDEALVQVALDLGGRPYYRGPLPSRLYDHWMRSFADNAQATLHLRVLRGTDRHHIVEAAFKALGLALRDALVDSGAVFSTKGGVALRVGR